VFSIGFCDWRVMCPEPTDVSVYRVP
jgi:hypothetical protein